MSGESDNEFSTDLDESESLSVFTDITGARDGTRWEFDIKTIIRERCYICDHTPRYRIYQVHTYHLCKHCVSVETRFDKVLLTNVYNKYKALLIVCHQLIPDLRAMFMSLFRMVFRVNILRIRRMT